MTRQITALRLVEPTGLPFLDRANDTTMALLTSGKVTPAHLNRRLLSPTVQQTQAENDFRLCRFVVDSGLMKPEELQMALARRWGVQVCPDASAVADPRLSERLGVGKVISLRLVPVRSIGGATLIVTDHPGRLVEHRGLLEATFGKILGSVATVSGIDLALRSLSDNVLIPKAESAVPYEESCRSFRPKQAYAGLFLIGLAVFAWVVLAPLSFLLTLAGLLFFASTAFNFLKLMGLIFSFQNKVVPKPPALAAADLPVISILVPMFREEAIARKLIRRLKAIDYPTDKLDILLVVEAEDPVTQETLRLTDLPASFRVIVVPKGNVRTKPRAMNYALDFCRGTIIGVYDAEDAPAPDQLRRIAARFHEADDKLACIQGCLDFYNPTHNWIARCFTIEYAAWFRLLLPGIVKLGLAVPLGGTTLFVRRSAIEAVGRWDAHNVTEDADLGIRFYRRGFRTEIMDIVTMEEANARTIPWIRQRSRWSKGFIMTWLTLMRHPIVLWRELGAKRFAGVHMMLIGSQLQILLAPIYWSFYLVPLGVTHPIAEALGPTGFTLLFSWLIGIEVLMVLFGVQALRRSGHRFSKAWVLTMPLYYPMATLATLKAIGEVLFVPFYWDKTTHGGFS